RGDGGCGQYAGRVARADALVCRRGHAARQMTRRPVSVSPRVDAVLPRGKKTSLLCKPTRFKGHGPFCNLTPYSAKSERLLWSLIWRLSSAILRRWPRLPGDLACSCGPTRKPTNQSRSRACKSGRGRSVWHVRTLP